FPLVGGIDVAGAVASSADPRFREGDAVLVTGYGLGEEHDGGYAEVVRVPADWVVPLPPGLGTRDAMALGTAGFTAALAVQRMGRRRALWARLAGDMRPRHLAEIARAIPLADLPDAFGQFLAGGSRGRIVVEVGGRTDG